MVKDYLDNDYVVQSAATSKSGGTLGDAPSSSVTRATLAAPSSSVTQATLEPPFVPGKIRRMRLMNEDVLVCRIASTAAQEHIQFETEAQGDMKRRKQ